MIGRAAARPGLPHLFSAAIACAIPIAILCGGRLVAISLEKKTIHLTAPRDFFFKNQGLAFQRAAAGTSDILLLYGSSELRDPIPNRASDFFAREPSGFQVCPVGKAGTTSLIILQKVGAVGRALRDRKVAISLSPSWFFTPAVNPYAYAGNFSLPAASGVIFDTSLNLKARTEIAKRMLQFPDTLDKSALLRLAATCLASGRPLDHIIFMVIWPLGQLENAVFDLQDHFEALVYLLGGGESMPMREPQERVSPRSAVAADQRSVTADPLGSTASARDAVFRARIAAANEWDDLELLFRTLTDLKAKPLILSMPIDGALYDARGVTRSARQVYYDRVKELAQRYRVQLAQFEEHDGDPSFLIAHHEHPSREGWTYYNKALDDFFHETSRPSAPSLQ